MVVKERCKSYVQNWVERVEFALGLKLNIVEPGGSAKNDGGIGMVVHYVSLFDEIPHSGSAESDFHVSHPAFIRWHSLLVQSRTLRQGRTEL